MTSKTSNLNRKADKCTFCEDKEIHSYIRFHNRKREYSGYEVSVAGWQGANWYWAVCRLHLSRFFDLTERKNRTKLD